MADNTKSGNLWRRGDRLLVLSRQAREQGHEVRLMPAQYVKPYVKTNKSE